MTVVNKSKRNFLILTVALKKKVKYWFISLHLHIPYFLHFSIFFYFWYTSLIMCIYRVVTSARPCNKVGHLFWFTILAQHETNDIILYIHSVHKHRENSFKLKNYKMRLKQIRLNWINSMQVKKILFTNVFFSWSLCLLNMF